MRILNVVNRLDETGGGAAERVYQMSRHLTSLGHEVTILTTDYHLAPERVTSLAPVRVLALHCLVPRFFLPVPAFGRVLREVRAADVIHLTNHWTVINVWTYLAARMLGKPYVVCPLGALPIFGRSGLLKRAFNAIIGKRLIRNASGHVAATLGELPAFRDYGVRDAQVTHIPNGINSDDYLEAGNDVFLEDRGLGRAPYILFIGRLNPIKGADLLVKAFASLDARYRDHHLVLIGPDEGIAAGLQASAAELGVGDRVHFFGFVSRADKSRFIHRARLLAVPSRQEAMSIVVLEAGVSGRPVLITDQCGFDEVRDVRGGDVVPATVDGIRAGLNELLSDDARLAEMGDNLERFTRQYYLWPAIAQRYDALFRACAAA